MKSETVHVNGILDTLSDELVVVRGKGCHILFANGAARARLGPADQPGCQAQYGPAFVDLCRQCIGGEAQGAETADFEVSGAAGGAFAASAQVVAWLDGEPATVLRMRDITAEREARDRLYRLAYQDHLTGVPNRQKFRETFDTLSPEIAAGRQMGVLALFDLDNFKAINDTYGHNTGDVMLTRLAEYFRDDPQFEGRIYRLGGDEFVLLFSGNTGDYASEAAMAGHYEAKLQNALRRFTIPGIDLSCTLSMGVVTFPAHGTGCSELLRKADIALYRAKAEGRNRLVFFESRYDSAKKFKDLFISIQPLLTAQGKSFGYELADQGDGAPGTVTLTEFNRTLDALGLQDIGLQGMGSDARYFIRYTAQLLAPAVLKNLPRDMFIVQLPYPAPGSMESVLLKKLRAAGYRVLITDVCSTKAEVQTLVLADYCRFAPQDTNTAAQAGLIARLPQTVFIAQGIHDHAAFQAAYRLGFKLFQGYYFSRQATVQKTKELDPLRLNYFRLLQLTSGQGLMDFREISAIIGGDVALSYKLLRLLNSAAVGLREVTSIQKAVTYLGEAGLKRWIGLLALRGLGDGGPLELVRMSLIRARFGELLCPYLKTPRDSGQVFLAGMLSLLHVAMETTREALLADIPVHEDIRASLLAPNGPHSDLLVFYEHYEYANWEEVGIFCSRQQLAGQVVNSCYVEAVKWYNDLSAEPAAH